MNPGFEVYLKYIWGSGNKLHSKILSLDCSDWRRNEFRFISFFYASKSLGSVGLPINGIGKTCPLRY